MSGSINNDYLINEGNVRSAFNASAKDYDAFSLLQRTITERLIESFDQIKIKPGAILDLGSGTGFGSRKLKQRFKKAHIYQCDLSDEMLRRSKKQSSYFFSKDHFVCANAKQIPLSDNHFDLVFSSLMLQWCSDLDAVFTEVKRLLKPGGVFLFTSFGPDTLKELRDSWSKVDEHVHANAFVDIHDIGDALMRNGLNEPVLSVEHLTLTYDDCKQLMRDLKGIGAQNINSGRRKTLTGKKRLAKMVQYYESYRENNKLPATYEVIYGHAWQPDSNQAKNKSSNIQTISLDNLKKEFKGRESN